MKERIIALILASVFVFGSSGMAYAGDAEQENSVKTQISVQMESVSDTANDNTFATANALTLGSQINGSITETDDLDYYTFTIGSAGCVTLNMMSYMKYYCIKIYDSDGEQIWYTDYNEWTETVGYRKDTHAIYLEKGTYYMQINGYKYSEWYKSTGSYVVKTGFQSSGVTNMESDNSFAAANSIALGGKIVGQVSANDDYDTYQFKLSSPGCVTLDMISYMQYYCIKVFDSDGEEIWYTDYNEWTESVGYRKDTHTLYLEQGTYYIQINGYKYSEWYKSTGKYVVKTSFKSSGVSFKGDDNSFANANKISWNKTYTGQISINDDYDTYKFVVPTGKKVPIHIASYMQYYCINIFDSAGKEIWYTDENEWNSNVRYRKDTYNDVVLSSGTYYIQVNGYRRYDYDKSTGLYKFYIGTIQTTPKMPAKVIGASASSKTKSLKLKWKKVSGAKGYQICYSTSKNFKKKVTKTTTKTSYTLKKLKKKKTYYVKIRAYKVVNGKKLYGTYSKVIKKKTK